jgi:hypothetical protein
MNGHGGFDYEMKEEQETLKNWEEGLRELGRSSYCCCCRYFLSWVADNFFPFFFNSF